MSGRCNTHLYSSEATLSYRYPACKYLIPFFQSRFQHLAFHVLPSSSYVINNHCLNSARSTLKLVPISNPFHLFELCRNIPKGEIRGGIHRKFPSCFALVTCLADYLDDPNILLPDDYVLCIAPLFTVLRVPMCTKTYHFLQVQWWSVQKPFGFLLSFSYRSDLHWAEKIIDQRYCRTRKRCPVGRTMAMVSFYHVPFNSTY